MDQVYSLALACLDWTVKNPGTLAPYAGGALGWGLALRHPLWGATKFLAYWGTSPVWGPYCWAFPGPTPLPPVGDLAQAMLDKLGCSEINRGTLTTPTGLLTTLECSDAIFWLDSKGELHVSTGAGNDVADCLAPLDCQVVKERVQATFARLKREEIEAKAARAAESIRGIAPAPPTLGHCKPPVLARKGA